MFETEDGRFTFGWAPRKKAARPQLLEVPEMLRPILRGWWKGHGQPSSGFVFPALRGKRTGEGEKTTRHAAAMRRDLRRAFGLEVWDAATRKWKRSGRAMTARERELLEGTDMVRRVDFHSWRRAFNQALADAGVNLQQAQALAGHSSMEAHQRYLKNTGAMRRMPPAALPQCLPNRPEAPSGWQDGLPGMARTQPKTADPDCAPRAIRTHDHRIRSSGP
jgi:integrase